MECVELAGDASRVKDFLLSFMSCDGSIGWWVSVFRTER